MIVAVVTFSYPDGLDQDAFTRACAERRHIYERKPGLLQKIYWVAPERDEAGGIYVWESLEAAEGLYTSEWRAKAADAFGARPDIRFANLTDVIVNQALA